MNPSDPTLESADRSKESLDLDALSEFTKRLRPGARILDAGCGTGRDLRYFMLAGFQAEGIDASAAMVQAAREYSGAKAWQADLQLLNLPRESYDGIWAHRSLIHLPAPGCQRVMAIFFAALKSGGILFVSIEEGDDPQGPEPRIHRYRIDDFASLIRQSGFQLLAEGRSLANPSTVAFIARRV